MKIKLITLAAMVALSMPVAAEQTDREKMQEVCNSYYNVARDIMTMRQRGGDITEMMGMADNETQENMVIEAFEVANVPDVMADTENRYIREFAEGYYLDCVRYWETK